MGDREDKISVPVMHDPRKNLTREDLLRDASSLIQQAIQFYNAGEVEVSVAIAFTGDVGGVAFSTNIDNAERLRAVLNKIMSDVPKMALRARARGKIIQ